MPLQQSESPIEHSSAAIPSSRSRIATPDPLLGLAQRGKVMVFAAFTLGVFTLVAVKSGFSVAALIGATVAVTLALLAAMAALLQHFIERRRARVSAVYLQAALFNPDPVFVTDEHGGLRASNPPATDRVDPVQTLSGWCVEAALVADALLAEVQKAGALTREFWRESSGLRLSLYRLDATGGLFVWHFLPLTRGGNRFLDDLGLPVISRGVDGVQVNAAARGLLTPDDEAARLLADVEAAQGAGGSTPVVPLLSGGQSVNAIPVAGQDGARDVVSVPTWGISGETNAPAASNLEEIPVALVQIDPEGRVCATNRHARVLLGLPEGETHDFWEVVEGLGRPVADWLDDARNGRALGRPEVLRATLTGQDTFVQIILRRAAGQNPSGTLVAVVSDATELKSLEARFVQSQKMQAIGQLAGGVAHDFNNLLTAIAGHCDLLLLNRDRFDPDYNDLLQIHQNANRAAALVRQLLAFSRKQTMKPEVLRLESLLEDLTHLLTRLVGERISLSLTHDPEVGAIRADRRQLEQVIMNLVVNARDAMPMGGTIRIETEALRLREERELGRARLPGGTYALIRVIDQGVGIPKDIIDKIFEPFFTTKKMGEGTGLGLSTAYGIVKQMGGYIFADSSEGAGSTFTLYFAVAASADVTEKRSEFRSDPKRLSGNANGAQAPAVLVSAQEGSLAQPAAKIAARTAKTGTAAAHGVAPKSRALACAGSILLVEDEAPVRAFAARALRLQGYQVFEAPDGEQALEFLADPSIRVDIFVTDVVMPGIDGPGWVAQALLSRPGTPVVFVSGHTAETFSAALSRTPRGVFLGKPFSLKDLTDTIAQQLDPPGVAARA